MSHPCSHSRGGTIVRDGPALFQWLDSLCMSSDRAQRRKRALAAAAEAAKACSATWMLLGTWTGREWNLEREVTRMCDSIFGVRSEEEHPLIESFWRAGHRRFTAGSSVTPWALLCGRGLFRTALAVRDLRDRCRPTRVFPRADPIVSIGGLEVGGVGKLPLRRNSIESPRGEHLSPAILSRGYGSCQIAVRRVPWPWSAESCEKSSAMSPHGWRNVSTQFKNGAGIWVGRRRIDAAVAAARSGGV